MAQNNRGFDPTQTAEYWLEKGVHTVPLRRKSKRPKDQNWPQLRLVGEELHRKFKPGDNIGAIWGEGSDGATDVDLDIAEACWVAAHILPETLIYGRRNKPGSHYVFRCRGAETRKWQTKTLGTLLEIRSTGAQSVIPPSIHPEGDRYFIEEDVEFATLTRTQLERYCDEIAVGALMLHHYPESGSRHDYVHVCTGVLCHAGWPDEKIRRVMAAVLSEVSDDDEELRDRLTAVVNTIEHYQTGDHVKGLTSMQDWMEGDSMMGLRKWIQSGSHEGRLLDEPINIIPKKGALEFNEAWLDVPGLVGDITKWANKRAYTVQPMFGLAAAITCTALASCNNYLVQHWETPLQPYCMITGSTGSGKDSALKTVTEFAARIKLDPYVAGGIQSFYALLDQLAEPPNMMCLTWDEAARNLAAAKNINGPDFQTVTHILSLFGAANKILPAVPGRKNPIPELRYPFFVLLATAQPDMLMDALTNVEQETGFVNRMTLFDSGNDFPELNRDRKGRDVFPKVIGQAARRLRDHQPPEESGFTEIGFANERVFNQFEEFEELARRRTARKEYTWARANQNALVLAGTVAVGVDHVNPTITREIAEWAMQLVSWSNNCWEDRIRLTGGNNTNERESFKVQKMCTRPQDFINLAKSPKQVKQRKLMEKGFMPLSVLKRGTRSITPRRLEEILDDLCESDLIACVDKNDNTCYFAKDT